MILPLMAFTSFEWVTFSLDERVSVDFPVKPEQKEVSGNITWVAEENSNSRCMAMVLDFKNFGVDSAQLAAEFSNPKFAEDFKEGVLGQLSGASTISEKITTTLGYKTLEYVFDMGKKDTSSLNMMYNKNIFVGSKMYTMSFFEKNGKPQDETRNKFFKSFKLK